MNLSFGLIQSQNSAAYIGLASGVEQLLTTEDLNEMKVPYLRMVKSGGVELPGTTSVNYNITESCDLIGLHPSYANDTISYLSPSDGSQAMITLFGDGAGETVIKRVTYNAAMSRIQFVNIDGRYTTHCNIYLYRWTTL